MMDSRKILRCAALWSLLVVLGCASTSETPDPFRAGAPAQGDGEVMLTVQNNNLKDATIYAYWNGARDRIGTVTAKTIETFEMRWRSEDLQLEVDFLAGHGYRSETIAVWDGDHLEFQIQAWR